MEVVCAVVARLRVLGAQVAGPVAVIPYRLQWFQRLVGQPLTLNVLVKFLVLLPVPVPFNI